MSRIFISFLGTGDYLECAYQYQDDIIKNVRFVQEATIILNCKDWSENDRVVIFTTQEAFRKNWKNNRQKSTKTKEFLERSGLENRLNDLKLACSVKQVDIPDGRNESEIWEIFSIVFEEINQNDEIIFDITHAFRSIPMLAIVILNYAKVIKDVSLQGLYYGAMEAVGTYNEVKKMPLEKRILPIVDLTSFDYLMEWSTGIDQFLKSGNAEKVSKLADKSARTILSHTKGRDRSQHTIRRFAENLEAFTKTLSTCRGRDISDNVIRLKQDLDACKRIDLNSPLNRPLQPLFKKISDQLDLFPEKSVRDGIQAAKWCLEHNLIQQGYTILQEILISHFVSMIGENPEKFDNKNKNRTIANQAVTIFLKKLPEQKWFIESLANRDITDKFLNLYKKNTNLIKTYRSLANLRNDINHCGYNDNPAEIKTLEKNLKGFINKIEKNI